MKIDITKKEFQKKIYKRKQKAIWFKYKKKLQYETQQTQIKLNQLSKISKDQVSNMPVSNNLKQSLTIQKNKSKNKQVKSLINCQQQKPNIQNQIYNTYQITLKKNKQYLFRHFQQNNYSKIKNKEITQIEQNLSVINRKIDDNQFNEYEQVKLYNNEFTKVNIQYNQEKKKFTIKKYFKQNDIQQFKKEIQILKDLAKSQITLPLVTSSKENNNLWYEQLAGQKDLQILLKYYSLDKKKQNNLFCFSNEYLKNIKIIFCKLFKKLDKMFEMGYAHSDIKPQNIVLGFDFEPYFIDFGASVKLNDFQNYLNQFTPSYNHSRYLKQNQGKDGFNQYEFTNEEEIKYCERTQLTISLLYMIIKPIQDFFQGSKKMVELLKKYKREKDFNKLIQILSIFVTQDFKIFDDCSAFNICRNLVKLDDDLIDILNLIEQPDKYEKIKNKIYEISDFKINCSIFSDFDTNNVLYHINLFNLNLINIYLDENNQLEIMVKYRNDLELAQYSQEHKILYYLFQLFENYRIQNKILIKKQFNTGKIIYEIPFIQFPYYEIFQFEIQDLKKLKYFQINDLIFNSTTVRYLKKKSDQFRIVIKQLAENKYQNILQECQSILQNKLFDKLINDVRKFKKFEDIFFERNKFIIKIYEVNIIDDTLFNVICELSNQKNEFELVFIDCTFHQNILIKIHSFIKSYQRQNILFSNEDHSLIKKSSVTCQLNSNNKINEISGQKGYIKIQLIHTKSNTKETDGFQKMISSSFISRILKQNLLFQNIDSQSNYSFNVPSEVNEFEYFLNVYSRIQKQIYKFDKYKGQLFEKMNEIYNKNKNNFKQNDHQDRKMEFNNENNFFEYIFHKYQDQILKLYNEIYLNYDEDYETLVYQIPQFQELFVEESSILQRILKEYSKSIKDTYHINFLKNNYNDNIQSPQDYLDDSQRTIIINQNDFFIYFFGQKKEDSNILKQKIFDSFVIINIDGIEYLISNSTQNQLSKYFSDLIKQPLSYMKPFNNQDSLDIQINEQILVITILSENLKQSYFLKSNGYDNKMRKLKNLFPYLMIEHYYSYIKFKIIKENKNSTQDHHEIFEFYIYQLSEFNQYEQYYQKQELIFKRIQASFKLCKDFYELFDIQNQQIQFNNEYYYIFKYQKNYRELEKQNYQNFAFFINSFLDQYESVFKLNQIFFQYENIYDIQQIMLILNLIQLFALNIDVFDKRFNRQLLDSPFSNVFYGVNMFLFDFLRDQMEKDQANFIDGQILYQQLKQLCNIQI